MGPGFLALHSCVCSPAGDKSLTTGTAVRLQLQAYLAPRLSEAAQARRPYFERY